MVMTSTSSRVLGKRLAQALSARHYSITRANSKGKHLPPPPPPAYGPGANSGAGSTPVKPSTTPSSPPPAKEAPKPPVGSGHVPSAASKPGVPPESLHKPESAAKKQKTQSAPADQPVASSVLEPPRAGAVLKDPAGMAATAPPKPPSTTAPGSKPATQPPSGGPPKIASGTKEQLKAPTTLAASKQPPPSQPAPPQKPPAADAVKLTTGPSPPAAAAAGGVGQDRAKQAYFAGGTGTRGGSDHARPPQGNAWLISKSLPVDVRLLAAGVATVGALYYFYDSRWQRQPQAPPPSQGGGDGGASSGATLGSAESIDQAEQPAETRDYATGPMEDTHDSREDELSGSDGGSADMSAGDFYTDELAMQSKEVKDEERQSEPPSTEQQSEPSPLVLPPPEPKMLKQEGIAIAAKAVERSIQDGQPVGLVDTKPVTDLLNEVGTGQWQMVESPGAEEKVGAAYAEVDALKEVVEEANAGKLPLQHLLGLTEDITADALLKKAVERAEREGEDWAVKHENLVQARADEKTFKEVLERAHEFQQAQLAAATAVAEANAERAEQIQSAADAAQKQFEQVLEDTVRLSNLQHIQDLLRQEEFLTTAAAEAAVRERSERAAALDEVRAKVNALGQAFSRRSDEQRDSTRAHQVSLGAFALENALARGQPYAQAASLLAQSCREDELVSAALQALPKESADKGIPTRAELLQRAPGLVSSTRQMAYIEAGHGGFISLGLARLAASLKVAEGSEMPGEGMDGALARMQGHLAAGRLAEAADALEAGTMGTAAEKAASEWARDARARALADQTTELLQAHACSLAVSQS